MSVEEDKIKIAQEELSKSAPTTAYAKNVVKSKARAISGSSSAIQTSDRGKRGNQASVEGATLEIQRAKVKYSNGALGMLDQSVLMDVLLISDRLMQIILQHMVIIIEGQNLSEELHDQIRNKHIEKLRPHTAEEIKTINEANPLAQKIVTIKLQSKSQWEVELSG